MSMVSVVMASYNGARYIKRQVSSILQNLSDNDELIISDDGSNDDTLLILSTFKDKRIKVIEGPRLGIVKNFEFAISHAKGEYIFLSDQDDWWFEDKVKVVLDIFLSDKNIILIQHDAIVISNHSVLYNSFAKHRHVAKGIIRNLIKNSYHGCCMAFRRKLIEEILPFPENIYLHDEWIGLVAEVNGETRFIDEKLMKYYRHDSNASSFKHLSIPQMVYNRWNYASSFVKYLLSRG